MSTFAPPRSSRSSIHYPEPAPSAYYAPSRGAPSVIYNKSDSRPPRSSSRPRRHSVSTGQARPVLIPAPSAHGPRSSVDTFAPRSSADFGPNRSPPGRRSSTHIHHEPRSSPPGRRNSVHLHNDPRGSSSSLRRPHHHDDHHDRDRHRDGDDRARAGTTKFPRKFVNRAAVEEAGWPFEEDRETGAIIVFQALSKHEIDALVERTTIIRKRRTAVPMPMPTSSRRAEERERDKHVAFSPERTTIIHQKDAPPASISAIAAGGAAPGISGGGARLSREELEDLSRKAKSEMEARQRAEEVARTVKMEGGGLRRGGSVYYGSGRRMGRDVVVVR